MCTVNGSELVFDVGMHQCPTITYIANLLENVVMVRLRLIVGIFQAIKDSE
jgi:hypothetical protein